MAASEARTRSKRETERLDGELGRNFDLYRGEALALDQLLGANRQLHDRRAAVDLAVRFAQAPVTRARRRPAPDRARARRRLSGPNRIRMAAPTTRPRERTRSLEQTLPPHTVVLHNDDHNAMDHVVRALLVSVPELSTERAAEIMLAAHLHGLADVITCPLERAELYRDRLQQHGLTATIRRG